MSQGNFHDRWGKSVPIFGGVLGTPRILSKQFIRPTKPTFQHHIFLYDIHNMSAGTLMFSNLFNINVNQY